MSEKHSVVPGNWIKIPALFPGIWLVSRVLSNFHEDRWNLDDPKKISDRTLVFCDRLVSNTWNRSFARQCCEASYVAHLDEEDNTRLRALVAGNSKLMSAFEKYCSTKAQLDLVSNISMGRLADRDVSNFPQFCSDMLASRISSGVTLDEVLLLLRERNYEKHIAATPRQVTLQLVSTGHELRGSDFVFRKYRTLGF